MVSVEIDFSTDDIYYLYAICMGFKGSCSFGRGPGESDKLNPAFN